MLSTKAAFDAGSKEHESSARSRIAHGADNWHFRKEFEHLGSIFASQSFKLRRRRWRAMRDGTRGFRPPSTQRGIQERPWNGRQRYVFFYGFPNSVSGLKLTFHFKE